MSEFGARHQKNTLVPQVPNVTSPAGNSADEREELSATEKLRLVYLTGQEDDSTMLPDPKAFKGEQNRHIE